MDGLDWQRGRKKKKWRGTADVLKIRFLSKEKIHQEWIDREKETLSKSLEYEGTFT